MRYTVIPDPNPGSGAYTVTVPALPGCITQGATFDDAVTNAQEAIAGFIETLEKLGEPVPREDEGLVVPTIDASSPAVATAWSRGPARHGNCHSPLSPGHLS